MVKMLYCFAVTVEKSVVGPLSVVCSLKVVHIREVVRIKTRPMRWFALSKHILGKAIGISNTTGVLGWDRNQGAVFTVIVGRGWVDVTAFRASTQVYDGAYGIDIGGSHRAESRDVISTTNTNAADSVADTRQPPPHFLWQSRVGRLSILCPAGVCWLNNRGVHGRRCFRLDWHTGTRRNAAVADRLTRNTHTHTHTHTRAHNDEK